MSEAVDVWKMIHSITNKKDYFIDDSKEYIPWIANRYFASHIETFEEAETMNLYHFLDKDMQYDFLYNAIPTKKLKFKQWLKKNDAEKKLEQTLKDVGTKIGYNIIRTKQFWNMLDKKQQTEFLDRYIYPDSRNSKK